MLVSPATKVWDSDLYNIDISGGGVGVAVILELGIARQCSIVFCPGKVFLVFQPLHIKLQAEIYISPVDFWQNIHSRDICSPQPPVMLQYQNTVSFFSQYLDFLTNLAPSKR